MEILVYSLIGIAVFILTTNIFYAFFQPRLSLRLPAPPRKKTVTFFRFPLLKPLANLNQPLANSGYALWLQRKLEMLKYKISALELLGIKEIFALVAGVLAPVLFSPEYILIAVLIAFFLPDILLYFKVSAKKKEIIRVIPETIDLISMCINAGLDFLSSINWVTQKAEANLFVEQLAMMASEVSVGKFTVEALKDMGKRLDLPEVNSFVRTLVLADRMGTPVAETFRILSEDLRNLRFQRGERIALKAPIKILFPLLFCILPVIFIVVAGPIIIKFSTGQLFPTGGF